MKNGAANRVGAWPRLVRLCGGTAVVLLCAACPVLLPGQLTIGDLKRTAADLTRGTVGSVFVREGETDQYTAVGTTAYAAVPTITNTGAGDLAITGIRVYEPVYDTEGATTGEGYNQDVFGVVGATVPDLPLVLAPSGTLTGLVVSFSPRRSGAAVGILALDTDTGKQYVAVEGIGAWILTLTVTGQGKIVKPVEVLAGSVDYRSPSDDVVLEGVTTHPLELTDLVAWNPVTGAPVVAEPAEAVTTVTLSAHSAIQAVFAGVYLFVPGDFGTVDAALQNFDPDTRKGIVVAAGTTWTVSGSFGMIRGVLRGGYRADFAARAYETPAQRADPTYRTVITGTLPAGANADATSLIEGFVIQGGAGANALTFTAGALTAVRYNDITAGANAYAIYADGGHPTIENNTITGSAATGDTDNPDSAALVLRQSGAILRNNTITAGSHGIRTVGVFVSRDPPAGSATITGNTIMGGTTDIAGARSFGVYVDFFSTPTIQGNTISGGTASGAGGRSAAVYVTNSSSPIIHLNVLDGGTGNTVASAIDLYGSGWPVITSNQLFTTPAEGATGYGVIMDHGSRVETLAGNHFSAVEGGLLYHRDMTGEVRVFTSLDELNEAYVPEPTDDEPVNTAE